MDIKEKCVGCEVTNNGIIFVENKMITSIASPFMGLIKENENFTKSNGIWIPERKIILPNVSD